MCRAGVSRAVFPSLFLWDEFCCGAGHQECFHCLARDGGDAGTGQSQVFLRIPMLAGASVPSARQEGPLGASHPMENNTILHLPPPSLNLILPAGYAGDLESQNPKKAFSSSMGNHQPQPRFWDSDRPGPALGLFGTRTAAPLEAAAKDPSGSHSHCLERFSGIAVDTRPAPPILAFIVVFIFCPSRAAHGRALQEGSAGSAVYGAFPQGMTGFGFLGFPCPCWSPGVRSQSPAWELPGFISH